MTGHNFHIQSKLQNHLFFTVCAWLSVTNKQKLHDKQRIFNILIKFDVSMAEVNQKTY
jgi:hypothetical protein